MKTMESLLLPVRTEKILQKHSVLQSTGQVCGQRLFGPGQKILLLEPHQVVKAMQRMSRPAIPWLLNNTQFSMLKFTVLFRPRKMFSS